MCVLPDIHAGGDELVGDGEGFRIEVGVVPEKLKTALAHYISEAAESGAREGGVIELLGLPDGQCLLGEKVRVRCRVEGCDRRAVCGDMVGVAVAAPLVVGDDDLRMGLPDQLNQAA